MSDLANLKIWDDPAIRDALSWYLDVAENRRPAKFRIAATLSTELDPATENEEAVWNELDRLMPRFLERWRAIRMGEPLSQAVDGPSLLELTRELAYRMLAHCNFCPWLPGWPNCGHQAGCLQARLWLARELPFPSHRGRVVLPGHAGLRHHLLYLLQHALRLLSERRHQHR